MAIERVQYGGADQQPPSSLSPKPSEEITTPPQTIRQTIEEMTPMALDALDSDKSFPVWAGGQNWREEGIKQSLFGSPRFKGRDISYFGSKPQGGPSLFLKVRDHHGEGVFFQLGRSDSNNEGGKLDTFIYWDETGKIHDLTRLEPAERAEYEEKARKYFQRLKESLAAKEA